MRVSSLWAVGAAWVALAGCGGGGTPTGGQVTRDTEPSLSRDALILAAGASKTPWLDLATARKIDADLGEIRASHATLAGVHARGDADPKTLIVQLDSSSPRKADWSAGRLALGSGPLDAALTRYRAIAVHQIGEDFFVLTFDQWLNTEKLAAELRTLGTELKAVDQNGYIGDGDDIEIIPGGYRFRRGWGDCPAGCTEKHFWSATKNAKSWSVTESGSPLGGA